MPEIAEVARIVHFLRLHLVGKKISSVSAPEDAIIFGKVGTSGPEFEKALTGRKVVSAGSQGKYFWIALDKPPHVVMHFGMTGWIHIKGERTAYTNYYKKMKAGEADQWPPRFCKWQIITASKPAVEVAFTDPRRLGRVRLVDCPGEKIRQNPPLSANGPDPVVDADIFSVSYLGQKMRARKVPIKALLLDQTAISGIGNWVADEVLFQSRTHPEQYCNDFSDAHIRRLHGAIRTVCQTACDLLGDSDQFPKDWLFSHRWGKGKGPGSLPSGEKLGFITVGGRTSCYAPALQLKTGKLTAEAEVKVEEEVKKALETDEDDAEEPAPKKAKSRAQPTKKAERVKKETPTTKKTPTRPTAAKAAPPKDMATEGRRRSGRTRGS